MASRKVYYASQPRLKLTPDGFVTASKQVSERRILATAEGFVTRKRHLQQRMRETRPVAQKRSDDVLKASRRRRRGGKRRSRVAESRTPEDSPYKWASPLNRSSQDQCTLCDKEKMQERLKRFDPFYAPTTYINPAVKRIKL